MSEAKPRRLIEMKKFINEWQYATGRINPLMNSMLPDPASLPSLDVRIPKQRMVEFRNDYLLLVKFAALQCNVPEDELTGLHLLMPLIEEARKHRELEESL